MITAEILQNSDGAFHWVAKVRNQPIAKSYRDYATKADCIRRAQSVLNSPKIIDETTPRPSGRTKAERNWCPPV